MKLAVQGGVIQLVSPAPSENHDIHRGQTLLLQTDGFTNQSLQTVAIDGAPHVLLAEDQAEAHMTEVIASTQGHQPLAVDLEVRMVEDMSIVPGRQQTQPPGKALTGHA